MAVFEHPRAGFQLVKGGIKSNESPEAASARELFEESGLETRATLALGQSGKIADEQLWHFTLCRIAPPVRDRWQHFTRDDGGHLFRFHWLNLQDQTPDWHPHFQAAINWIKAAI
ncbi:MAG: NUDIX domain-containing protein [Pseudomonadota bacterium]